MRDPRTTRNPRTPLSVDPHSVPGVLTTWCAAVTEDRHLTPPARTVPAMAAFLDLHLDWLTRQEWITELHTELKELHTQLRSNTARLRRIGRCPNPLDPEHPEHPEKPVCNAALYAPLPGHGDTIRCWSCHHEWPRVKWLALGDALNTP